MCWSLFFNKVASLQACNFIKKRLQRRCFLVNIVKFLKTPILKNTWERLLLDASSQLDRLFYSICITADHNKIKLFS